MLISRTSQYAIQALIYIGLQKEGVCTMNGEIARRLGVPSAYLAKIMQILCHGGLLVSHRGRRGGFSLREPSENINLMQVLSLIEGEKFHHECLLGLNQCGDETACPMHSKWKPIKAEILEAMESQSIATLALAVSQGKYRLTDIPA